MTSDQSPVSQSLSLQSPAAVAPSPPHPLARKPVKQEIEQARGRDPIQRRAQVQPPGHRANGDERPQFAQEQVERVAGGMGNAQLWGHHLKLEGIGFADGAPQGEQVEGDEEEEKG